MRLARAGLKKSAGPEKQHRCPAPRRVGKTLLRGPRRIVLLAGDLAVHLAHYLEYQMSLLGLPIFAATSAGRILHIVRSVNKQDLVIAISFRRGLRQTIEGAQQARVR